jgi:hypothetical protein
MQPNWEFWIDMGSRQLWDRIQNGILEGVKILMTSDVTIVEID